MLELTALSNPNYLLLLFFFQRDAAWWDAASSNTWSFWLEDKGQTYNQNMPQWFNSSVFVLPRSVLLLLKNPTFIFLCLAGATEATLIAGMSTFGPKFLESQFSLSASEAATFFGKETRLFCNVFPFCLQIQEHCSSLRKETKKLCSSFTEWLLFSGIRIISHQHICTKCVFRAVSADIKKKRVTSVAICYPLEEGKIIVVYFF